MLARQTPGGESRPVPIGSRLIGVRLRPAIPRRVAPQQSPPPLHQSAIIVAEPAHTHQMRGSTSSLPPGVSSLLCTPGDISILRRHLCKRHIEMTPLCTIEVTLPWVLGSRGCTVAVYGYRPSTLAAIAR